MHLNTWKRTVCAGMAVLMLAMTGCQRMDEFFGFVDQPEPTPTPKPQVTVEYGEADPVAVELYPDEPTNYMEKDKYVWENRRVTYTDENMTVMTGIDVSEHQLYPEWDKVAANGIDFAMIRLGYRGSTEGQLYTDPIFQYNLKRAANAGLKIGIYFFSQATSRAEAEAEAYYVLGTLEQFPEYKQYVTMPIVFDWEEQSNEGSRSLGLDGKTVTTCAKYFTDVIREAGYTPGVYFNRNMGYYLYDLTRLDSDVECWFAGEGEYSDFYYAHSMWQYTFYGSVEGINGNVDLNLYVKPNSAENTANDAVTDDGTGDADTVQDDTTPDDTAAGGTAEGDTTEGSGSEDTSAE